MQAFDDFDSSSQYGVGLDDTSSVISGYTARTQQTGVQYSQLETASQLGLDTLSLADESSAVSAAGGGKSVAGEEDFDGILDDMKDDGSVELPTHACRLVISFQDKELRFTFLRKLLWNSLAPFGCQMSDMLEMVLQLAGKHFCFTYRESSRSCEA